MDSSAWSILSAIEVSIQKKINELGIPLAQWGVEIYRGILTGYNQAFVIDSATKDQLIQDDPRSAELIRPILRGRDIQRFSYTFANLWLICTFPSRQYDIDDFPAIKKYLLTFGIERLEQTGKKHIVGGQEIKSRKKTNNRWFETQDSISYWNDFSKPKIIWKRIGSKIRFSYDSSGILCLDSTCFATGSYVAYLVAVLNSLMGNYLLKESPKTGTGDLIISVQALEPVRIPRLSTEEQKTYQELLARILEHIASGKDYTALEQELNTLVFDTYGLTEEERDYVSTYVSNAYR